MRKPAWLAMIALAGVLALYPIVRAALPAPPRDILQPEEPAWRGILTIWLVETWRPASGSHRGWLAAQARAFERAYPNALISLESVSPQAAALALEGVTAAPDALVWGSGVDWAYPQRFPTITLPEALSEALRAAVAAPWDGDPHAAPIALGGYALLVNTEDAAAQGIDAGDIAALAGFSTELRGKAKRSLYGWNASLPAYTGDVSGLAAELGLSAEGLPPDGLREEAAAAWPGFALDRRSLAYIGTQREAARLATLASAGKTFAWSAAAASRQTDQLLLFSLAPRAAGLDGEEYALRSQACLAFLAHLCTPEAQAALASAGSFPALPGEPLYQDEAMALLEAALRDALPAAVWSLPQRNGALREALISAGSARQALDRLIAQGR